MPLYEYMCLDCKTRFDALRSMKDADLQIDCVQCGGNHTSRLISLFNAQSGGRVIASSAPTSCAGCSATSCSTCGRS
jgi:putative FmdB family regulatory protein